MAPVEWSRRNFSTAAPPPASDASPISWRSEIAERSTEATNSTVR